MTMPLDPQAQLVIEAMRSAGMDMFADVDSLTPVQMRELSTARRVPAPVAEVAKVEDRTIAGPDGNDIPIRIYWPSDDGEPRPVVVFFHGGGWVIGGIDSHDGTVRSLTNLSGAIFVSIEYRLAPEARFPAAPEDCYAATVWAAENAAGFGGDASRLAVAGDSAGANLAAVVPIMARDRGGPALAFQLLVYPCTDMAPERWASMTDNATGYFLTADGMRWFYDHYADPADRLHPHAAPIRADDLHGLPPALVITAEFDPLRDEGEAYAARLADAGVPTDARRYDGQIHGFFSMTEVIDRAREAQADAAKALRSALGL
jgi:acetyl esterase